MAAPNIPTTMHAWRKHKGDKIPRWEQVPVPKAASTGFLVKLLASGVCHSDYAILQVDDRPQFQDVFILGHEGCGEIVQIGDKITDTRYGIGTKVALLAVPGCGQEDCSNCSRDMPQLCERGQHHGIGEDGFYAEYVAIDIRGCILLPEGVDPKVAAVATDAVTTAYHGIVRRAEVQKDELIFLFGLGGLGFNALQIVLKAIQARVIVSDVRQERLDAAAELGVPREDIVPLGVSIPDWIQERGLTERVDTVLDFVGKNQSFSDAQKIGKSPRLAMCYTSLTMIVRRGGKILAVGTLDTENSLDMKNGIRKRLSIIFTYGGQRRDLEAALDLISQGVLNPQIEAGMLEDFPSVLDDLHHGKIKARMALIPPSVRKQQA